MTIAPITRSRITHITIIAIASMLPACAVGPRYIPPQVPVPPAFKEDRGTPDEQLQPAQPADHVSRQGWWDLFGDTELNDLEARLTRGNPTLAEAEARVREARALVRQDKAAYFPTVTATGSATRSRAGVNPRGDTISGAFTNYNLGVGASWEADLWGRIRQTVSAGTASAQAAAGDR